MEIIVQKYEIETGGKIYNISTQVGQNKLRLICEEKNTENPLSYFAEFSLMDLMQLSSIFASISSLSEAQNIFENIIINQKIEIESQGEYIYLKILIKKEGMEESFSILLNLFNQNAANNQSVSYQPIVENIGTSQPMTYDASIGVNGNSQEELANQYLSLIINNQDNGQIIYSTTANTTTTTTEGQYTEKPQEQYIQTMQGSYSTGNNNSYENKQSYKTKRRTMDKLILSLRAQEPEPEPEPQIVEQVQSTPAYQQKIVETITTTNINQEELDNLRNENNRLNNIILQLKSQIEMLVQENKNLKLQNSNILKTTSNGNESQEVLLLKEELEKYIKEIQILRNKLVEFEQYKLIKEQEINSLKVQIDELLINQKKLEEYNLQKQREIDELKAFIDELLKKQKLDQSQYQNILKTNQKVETNLEDQMLSIQDTRLEIVKGDIIQDVKELELLSRKISQNNRKIILNLLYKATIDSDKAEIFHKKCDMAKSTLVLVKSGNGKRFGGYTTKDWKGNSIEKKDNNAFVFSLDKMKIYDIIPDEDAIGCYPKYGPVFLGCQIRLYDEFFSQGGTTFEKGMNYSTEEDYELTDGMKKFDVKEVEVYSVELE